jgi:hypothetical protein
MGGLRKGSVYNIERLEKKVSQFQTFGLEVLIFTANAAKAKEVREGNRSFGVVWVGRRK